MTILSVQKHKLWSASGGTDLIFPTQRTMWNIIASGLPAALMQCLYLFFTVPLKKTSDDRETSEDDAQTQEMLVQVRCAFGGSFALGTQMFT